MSINVGSSFTERKREYWTLSPMAMKTLSQYELMAGGAYERGEGRPTTLV
jgi:hypothetical protein